MLEFAEVTIEDKELFEDYLKKRSPQISDISFTNLYMWRNFYKFRYTLAGGLLCVIAVPEDGAPYALAPFGEMNPEGFKEAVLKLKEVFDAKGWQLLFKKVAEDDLSLFRELGVSEGATELDRDNSDYVYHSSDLIGLKGKKFDGKRNHINKFKKTYTYEYVELDEAHLEDCLRIMDSWCSERKCEDHKAFFCEKLANKELLDNFRRLGCKGAIMKVDGSFEGFTIGDMLNENTAVIHIEKANSHVDGLYTMINQQFCQHQWEGVEFINREQDLGVPGLRKAKLSYNPCMMVNKYNVIF